MVKLLREIVQGIGIATAFAAVLLVIVFIGESLGALPAIVVGIALIGTIIGVVNYYLDRSKGHKR